MINNGSVNKIVVSTTINKEKMELLISPHQSLLEMLREVAGLTGTKEGCNDGTVELALSILMGELLILA